MKYSILASAICIVLLCSCQPTGNNLATDTDQIPATPTVTTLPATPGSTSNPVLPVMQGTPYSLPVESMDPDNASRIILLARWEAPADNDQGRTIVSFSPDGTRLATANEGFLTIWDTVSGSPVSMSGDGKFLALSPDWSQVAMRSTPNDDSTILLLNMASGQQLGSWRFSDGRSIRPAFSPDGKVLVLFGGDMLQLCDTINGNTLAVLQGDRKFQSSAFAFSTDGKRIVTTYLFMENPVWHDAPPDGNIQVWDVASGTKVVSYHVTEKENIVDMAFSPDGSILAVLTQTHLVLWDLATGSLVKNLETAALTIHLAHTPDRKLVAVGGDAGGVVLLNPSEGSRLDLEPFVSLINSLAFSPDGKLLAVTGEDGALFIWGVPQ